MDERTRQLLARGTVVTMIVLLAAAWIYVFAVAGQAEPDNTIQDDAFVAASKQRCEAAIALLDALPTPRETATSVERSVVVVEATDDLAAMIADLRAMAPEPDDPEDGWVHDWLDDWDHYIEDRYAYADALLEDPEARFLITVRNGRDRMTADIDQVALANSMRACETPKDV